MPDETTVPHTRLSAAEMARCASELVSGGSIEMSAHRLQDVPAIADVLPVGTPVYVNHLPRNTLAETLAALVAVRRAGLEPVPHLAARRLSSRAEATGFLRAAVERAGVAKLLLIAGDTARPAGPYADGASLLADGVFEECGIRELGLPGYPEGHPKLPAPKCAAALDQKLALARARGIGTYVLTQFSFAPHRVAEFCADVSRRAPEVPIYVGIAGPANPLNLLRFAQACGVGASFRAMQAQGMGAVRLMTHTDPDAQLAALAHHSAGRGASNVVGVHLYSFGGVKKTAAWMNGWIIRRDQGK